MPCAECDHLAKTYLAALTIKLETDLATANLRNPKLRMEQREEAKGLELACENALAKLKRHQEKHGC
jgi:hypothetical protein